MKRGIPLLVLALIVSAHAGERAYQNGTLQKIDINDLTFTMPLFPSTMGQNLSIPLHYGISYQFEIKTDSIFYIAGCQSIEKKSRSSEWIVNDPIDFRVEKGKLFLKRSTKGELRLGLITRSRIVPKSDADTAQQSVEPIPPFASWRTFPKCK